MDSPKIGDLRVWHIPQVPGKPFHVYVDTPQEAQRLVNVLSQYDIFQYENLIKPPHQQHSPAMRGFFISEGAAMQNVPTIFHQATAGITPSADAKHWQAMCIRLRIELTQYDAPRCPAGQFEHVYQHPELGTLECHLDGERGDPDSGQRDTATLYSAYLRGVDIADRLTRDEVEAIELAAVKQPHQELHHVD